MKDARKTKKQLIEELEASRQTIAVLRGGEDSADVRRRLASERVRAAAMAMRSSSDLLEVAVVLYREIRDLGIRTTGVTVEFFEKGDSDRFVAFHVLANPTLHGISWNNPSLIAFADDAVGYMEGDPSQGVWEEVRRHRGHTEPWTHCTDGGEALRQYERFFRLEHPVAWYPDAKEWAAFAQLHITHVPFSSGNVAFHEPEYIKEHIEAVQGLAEALSLGYVRYLDFQRLEEQNRKLEVEQALERVRTQVAGMVSSAGLSRLVDVVGQELQRLGVPCASVSINTVDAVNNTVTFQGTVGDSSPMLMDQRLDIMRDWEQHRQSQATWVRRWDADYQKYTAEQATAAGLSQEEVRRRLESDTWDDNWVVDAFYRQGSLAMRKPAPEPFSDADVALLERFTEVFSLGYTRYLDLQAAEERVRQTALDIGVERVRSASMAMSSTADLPGVVATLFRELRRLGIDLPGAGINFVDEKGGRLDVWNVFPNPRKRGLHWAKGNPMEIDEETVCSHTEVDIADGGWLAVIGAWRSQEPTMFERRISVQDSRRMASRWELDGPAEAVEAWVEEWTGTFQCANVPFTYGTIGYHIRESTEEHTGVVRALAGALELGYLRYFDLQAAEERAAKAAREAAYERVRSAVLASRNTEDILGVSLLMEQELRGLGVPFSACGINLIDEEAREFRQFATYQEEGVDTPLSLDDPIVRQVVSRWGRAEVWMRSGGQEFVDSFRPEWREAASKVKVIVDVPFTYGTLAMNSAEVDEFADDEIQVLQGFADVISLAYTRYLDFQKVEKRNRALAEANQRIQEETQRKSEFLSRMSHDLRTPMNAIIGYTRILLRRLKGAVEERQYRNLENIQTSADNLLVLINEVLDLSRIEAGRVDLKPEPVDLGKLIGECIASVASLANPGVDLVQDLEEVPTVTTDADRIRRVVMNLLGNAVKFTEWGSITVSLKPVDSGVELAVADTGVGIPAEDLPYIFEEFCQVERQVGDKTEGTGLGLAIAAKSVEMLGGAISAESEVGKGTTFTLRIGDYV